MPLAARPGIEQIKAYVGGESGLAGADRVIRLASNENPLGPSPAAVEAYRAIAQDLHRYPDGGSVELRETLQQVTGLDAAQIVCGSGSDELIALLVRLYAGPGDEVLYSAHGFLMYAIAAKGVGATPVSAPESNLTADVDALLERVSERTRLVFLANPNNPTGSYLPTAELARLRAGLPDNVLLVIDAAYAEYVSASDYDDGAGLVAALDNVVMLRTFSKIYGLAALRLGWAYCPPAVADLLNRLRGPFNVTAPAQAAGVAALRDQAYVHRCRDDNARTLAWFTERVRGLGLEVAPSVGNFVLASFPERPGADAKAAAAHLRRRGILVRGMAGYGLPSALRISIGTDEDMAAVVEALSDLAS